MRFSCVSKIVVCDLPMMQRGTVVEAVTRPRIICFDPVLHQHPFDIFEEIYCKCVCCAGTDDVLSETCMDGILYLEDEYDKVWYI
jgi:hypothetical protein